MDPQETVELKRDVDAAIVPSGMRVTLMKGEQAVITQSLGGAYTVIVNNNMFRIEAKDADALGKELVTPERTESSSPKTREELEEQIWTELKNVYDPEIPVNVVDLGLIYDCRLSPMEEGTTYHADVKMTLTAPGCGMGPVLQQDITNRLLSMDGVEEAEVELVWDPPWNQGMMSEAARLQLGLY
jgi:probable FeS assembly SUF system protein SufT